MANKRICVQVDFNGPSPFIIKANGTFDKRTSLLNLARLIRGIDTGAQNRPTGPTTVVVQQSLVQASATVTPAAVALADTVSIGGTALTATQLRASGTVTMAAPVAADTVTVNGVVFTAVNGAVVLGQATFDVSGADAAKATSFVAQFNAYADSRLSGAIKAKATAAVVTLYAANRGTTGNGYTLASSNGVRLAVSGATLAGGAATANNQFDSIGTNAETGADIARAVNASTTANVKQTSATVTAAGVVTVKAKTPGVAGNAITFTSSNGGRLAVTGGGFLAAGSAGAPTQWTF